MKNKFYIRRHECWGGTYVYSVADADTRKQASKTFRDERSARRLMDRMNNDWRRYVQARASEFFTGPHGPARPLSTPP
jgi:hypothetical protein